MKVMAQQLVHQMLVCCQEASSSEKGSSKNWGGSHGRVLVRRLDDVLPRRFHKPKILATSKFLSVVYIVLRKETALLTSNKRDHDGGIYPAEANELYAPY